MVLLDDLEVDVQHSKRPFEEQEREVFFEQWAMGYEQWAMSFELSVALCFADCKTTRLRVAVAWATLSLRGLTTKDKRQKLAERWVSCGNELWAGYRPIVVCCQEDVAFIHKLYVILHRQKNSYFWNKTLKMSLPGLPFGSILGGRFPFLEINFIK